MGHFVVLKKGFGKKKHSPQDKYVVVWLVGIILNGNWKKKKASREILSKKNKS